MINKFQVELDVTKLNKTQRNERKVVMLRKSLAIFVLFKATFVHAETQTILGLVLAEEVSKDLDNVNFQNATQFEQKLTLITKDKHSLQKNNTLGNSILENARKKKIFKKKTIRKKNALQKQDKQSRVKGVHQPKILPSAVPQQNITTTKTPKTIVKRFKVGNRVTTPPTTSTPSLSDFPSLAPSFSEVTQLAADSKHVPTLLPTRTEPPVKEATGGNTSLENKTPTTYTFESDRDDLSKYTLRLITPFSIGYTTDGGTPDMTDYGALVNITEQFLDDSLAEYFSDIDEFDYYQTSIELFFIRDLYHLEYHAKSLFAKPGAVPSMLEIDHLVIQFLTSTVHLDRYRVILEGLGAENPFSTSFSIVLDGSQSEPLVVQSASQELPSNPKRQGIAVPYIAAASVLTVVAALIVYSKRRRARSTDVCLYDREAVANDLKPQPGDEEVTLDGTSSIQGSNSTSRSTCYRNVKSVSPDEILSSMSHASSLRHQGEGQYVDMETESSEDEEESEAMLRMDDVSLSDAISELEEASLNGSLV